MTQTRPRQQRPQTVLEVLRREQLGEHLVRLYLGGDGFDSFRNNQFTDKYIKIWFAKPELGLEPPYDVAELRERLDPEDLPVTRTYTVREVNDAERWVSVDFVIHGDAGLAAPWARTAQPGERVCFGGPGGAFVPDLSADWYLFVGDESSLPAIAASLAVLPATAVGEAFVEVAGPEDEQDLLAPSGVRVQWLHRGDARAGTSTILADAVRTFPLREGRGQVFAHGEREAMKALRDILLTGHGLDRSQVSLSGYWALGRTEDRFQAEKRTPVGQVLPD